MNRSNIAVAAGGLLVIPGIAGVLMAPAPAVANVAVVNPSCEAVEVLVSGFPEGVAADVSLTLDGVELDRRTVGNGGFVFALPIRVERGTLVATASVPWGSWTSGPVVIECPLPPPVPPGESAPPGDSPADVAPTVPLVVTPAPTRPRDEVVKLPSRPDRVCPPALRDVYVNGAGAKWIREAIDRGCAKPRPIVKRPRMLAACLMRGKVVRWTGRPGGVVAHRGPDGRWYPITARNGKCGPVRGSG